MTFSSQAVLVDAVPMPDVDLPNVRWFSFICCILFFRVISLDDGDRCCRVVNKAPYGKERNRLTHKVMMDNVGGDA